MKNIIVLLCWLFFLTTNVFSQTTKTIGGVSANYATIKAAFDAINTGSLNGAITLQITGSTTETASAVVNASGTGSANYSSIVIYPTASGFSVSGNLNAGLISLIGADNVTIDGRVNQTGATSNLVITNTNTGTAASSIRFYNSAENNTIRYCNISGSNLGSGSGVILFSSSPAGNGNDNNIIEYCNITNAGGNRPLCAILTSGNSGRENSGDIIRYNNIYNFFNNLGSCNGISILAGSVDWIVIGNSFYETDTFIPQTNLSSYCPIRVSTPNNHTISNNYIGGSEPLCGGSPWITNSNRAHYFCAIYISGGIVGASVVENNLIQNIYYTSVEDNPWDGIYINTGNVNVIGNTIGGRTGNDSIVINNPQVSATATISGGVVTAININGGGNNYTSPPQVTFSVSGSTTAATATAYLTNGEVSSIVVNTGGSGYTGVPTVIFDGQSNNYATSHGMINASSGTVNISNNNIGAITTIGSNYYSHGFESIYIRSNPSVTSITNNLIGSLTSTNSIYASSTAASSLIKQDVYGIYSASIGTMLISGNTVANLTNGYTGVNGGSRTRGIATITGSNTISNNTVRGISTSSGQTGTKSAAAVIGIAQSSTVAGTTQNVIGNIVYNLSNTNSTAKVDVYGIYYSGPASGTNTVSGNFIHSLSLSTSNITSDIQGIELYSGLTTCSNNIINLGVGINLGYFIEGIWDESGASNNNNIYFNSIYIGGTVTSGSSSMTASLRNIASTSTRIYKNNIFFNARSGGVSGKHYAINIISSTGLTINNNDYFVSGTGGVLGKFGAVEKSDLASWKSATSQDLGSFNLNPLFAIAGGTNPLDYYSSTILAGVSISGITTDYSGITRVTIPQLGALENNDYVWEGTTSTDFGTSSNWAHGIVPPDGADISFAASPINHCYLDQARTLKNITNTQASKIFYTNGKTLTITGGFILSNGAQINATSTSSKIKFTGVDAQSIPAGALVSNTLNSIEINNDFGLTIQSSLTISDSFILTSGAFTIGSNTITLNGAVISYTGTLIGGSTSNILISGNANVILPSVTINNLEINHTTGITLNGTVEVLGTLTLVNGTLTIDTGTLILSGNTPVVSGGNIDASNSLATIVFANSASITLPASLFLGNINNFTINGTGGLIASANLTVNGILDLVSSNPSTTKGILEMVYDYSAYPGTTASSYLGSYILNMGTASSTLGIGDVTGTIRRSSISANTPYTFGNKYTTITLSDGDMPDAIELSVTIGNTPSGNPDAIKRTYEIIPTVATGFNSNSHVTANFHYLDNELTSSISPYHVNTEANMVTMDYDIGGGYGTPDEHGRSTYDFVNNYIGMTNIPISYFINVTGHAWRTVFTLRDFVTGYYTWDGSTSSDWGVSTNWTPVGVPSDISHVIIPDALATPNDPILPPGVVLNTLTIENGGIMIMGNETLTIRNTLSGGWEDRNALGNDPGTSTVIFDMPGTTISGHAWFYNMQIDSGADVSNETGSTMKISGTVTKEATAYWYADVYDATIEYNGGNQSIILTDGSPNYHHLILSGTGVKTLPAAALIIHGNLILDGSVTTTGAANLSIGGNLIIGDSAIFNSSNYQYSVEGNFDNNGTFNSSTGSQISMVGSSIQSIIGSSTANFEKLIIDNIYGVSIYSNTNILNELSLLSGILIIEDSTLGINGSITRSSGKLSFNNIASLYFGGTSGITLPDNLFVSTPSLNNLTINRLGGVTLGNQGLIINGVMSLLDGTLTLGPNDLKLSGGSPNTSGGNLNATNSSSSIIFENSNLITLPTSFFLGNVNSISMNGIGGISLNEDITLNSTLTFNSGLIVTGANLLIFNSSSNDIVGASNDMYVDGNIRKIGNTSFTFPIGNNGIFAPIGITAPSNITDHFTAYYRNANPNTNYDVTSLDTGINHVSTCEYWVLNRTGGSSNVRVILSWENTRSCGVDDISSLIVARWDGSQWEDKGNSTNSGANTSGTITSNIVSSFSPFTLASKGILNPLPISIISFGTQCENQKTNLYWVTATEENNAYFEIQKSEDGKHWQTLEKVSGAGNSNNHRYYNYTDDNSNGASYYRLKQTDYNGSSSYSEIRFSDCNSNREEVIVFPVPSSFEINIIRKTPFLNSEYFLMNSLGQLVNQGHISGNTSTIDISNLTNGLYYLVNQGHISGNTSTIDISNLTNGLYYIRISDSSGICTLKIIKK